MMAEWRGPLLWGALVTAVTFVGSIVVVWAIIVCLPTDYLTRDPQQGRRQWLAHPALHLAWIIVRNVLGFLLLVAGMIMLLTPGQGVLCIFLGITLMDFPGKRALVLRMVSGPRVLALLNRIRGRAGRPPIEAPDA